MKLHETTEDGQHAHYCQNCQRVYDCPGLTVGLLCEPGDEKHACYNCRKHPEALRAWREEKAYRCHRCGNKLSENPAAYHIDPIEYARDIHNANVEHVCDDCFNHDKATGNYFESFGDLLDARGGKLINNDGTEISITDQSLDKLM